MLAMMEAFCVVLMVLLVGNADGVLEKYQQSPAPNLAKAYFLSDYVESHGARCLDGSPALVRWIE